MGAAGGHDQPATGPPEQAADGLQGVVEHGAGASARGVHGGGVAPHHRGLQEGLPGGRQRDGGRRALESGALLPVPGGPRRAPFGPGLAPGGPRPAPCGQGLGGWGRVPPAAGLIGHGLLIHHGLLGSCGDPPVSSSPSPSASRLRCSSSTSFSWFSPSPCVGDRKSTRLNSSHVATSYAAFCLKKTNTYNAHSPV